MKRAYRTTWGGVVSIVSAETVAQAKAKTMRSISDAGYPVKGVWNEIRVVRASEHDEWAAVDETRICWAECDLPHVGFKGK